MIQCASCHSNLAVRRLACHRCGISMEGEFGTPRLARLGAEDQQLVELFLLSGGSLKALAQRLAMSYPTVRKRMDALIEDLEALRAADQKQNEEWLRQVEQGVLTAEQAARLMQESAHGR